MTRAFHHPSAAALTPLVTAVPPGLLARKHAAQALRPALPRPASKEYLRHLRAAEMAAWNSTGPVTDPATAL